MNALRCDACKTYGDGTNWKRIEDAGFRSIIRMSDAPIEHLCPDCWAKAREALIPWRRD